MDFRKERRRKKTSQKRDKSEAIKYALKLLRYRVRFVGEVEERLKEQGFEGSVIKETIEELKKKGYLDDEKASYLFAFDEMKLKHFGPRVVKQKLVRLGVDEELAEKVVERVFVEIDWKEEFERIAKRFKDKHELRDYLYRRGFAPSQIEEILDQIDGGE